MQMQTQREAAAAWFHTLRDQIVAAFEALEDRGPGDQPAGRFAVSKTTRGADGDGEGDIEGGGGLMSVMRGGRVFEKVGVNWSAVYGGLTGAAQQAMAARGVPGIESDARFWASGISLVAHMKNPHAPAVHMNTRMFWTPGAWWFGGGADLNPALERADDTAHFHDTMRAACTPFGADLYGRYKAWADEYFYIPHRGRARGVGGIFYDDLNSGDWQRDFDFTKSVGQAFLPAFLPLAERRMAEPFSDADREAQLIHRGLYAEYNLVYDRGTKFGLATGHDADAVLMSLPPLAKWV